MKIALGPLLFPLERERLIKFYEEISRSPVSDVYLGEVVCHKRGILYLEDLGTICRMLQEAGKKVIISTLTLITNREETEYTEEICKFPFAVEANNMGVLNMAVGKEIIAGPTLNIYNSPSLKFLNQLGINRMVLTPELSMEAISSIIDGFSGETEIFGFGNLPLSFSWRCYTVRNLNLTRKNCMNACLKFPRGMPLETLDKNPVFTINGTQILSTRNHCLIGETDLLKKMGIKTIRISPQVENIREIIEVFKERLEGGINSKEAIRELQRIAETDFCNGWFYGKAGWHYITPEISAALDS